MKRLLLLSAVVAASATGIVPARADHVPAVMTHTSPDDLKWRDYPEIPGLQLIILKGNPREAGPYTLRVRFGPGVMSRPHWHPEERWITVLKGPWYAGAGEKFDPATTTPMPTGSFVIHHAKQIHYDGAKDQEVIVQISGIGPSATIFAHPEDDVQKRK